VAEHAAYRAKVDHHQAIHRLHEAGGSLREIAEALHLSHQRVHQIIDEAVEPTRRRRWRRREPQRLSGPAGPCSFCGRPRDVCPKLIAGPGVFICDRCVVQATRLAAGSAVDDEARGRCGWSRRARRPGAASAAWRLGRCGTWSPAGWRCRRASSASCPGSATSAGTCAWRSWPRLADLSGLLSRGRGRQAAEHCAGRRSRTAAQPPRPAAQRCHRSGPGWAPARRPGPPAAAQGWLARAAGHGWMAASWRASCRSRQSRRATIRPSRTVSTL